MNSSPPNPRVTTQDAWDQILKKDGSQKFQKRERELKAQLTRTTSWVEDWDDDDDFMIGNDTLTFRSDSSTNLQSHHRDSQSSFRSDRESLPGDERHVHLPADDEKATLDAIAAAAHAGIPIPTNVPPSALMGGTIKRLGGRKMKKIFQEDYADDLEFPVAGPLRLKPQDGKIYPESLRQVSLSAELSPVKQTVPAIAQALSQGPTLAKTLSAPINLEKFRDDDDDDDVFGDGVATIKASKLLPQSRPISLITPPTPSPQKKLNDDDFEGDLELPTNGLLKLSKKMDVPKTPALSASDDFDWGEGSLGTRFGGTKRDAFSTRSSSVSALSPSLASSVTAESEDEIFDGLLLPSGPLDLGERLHRRKQDPSPERHHGQHVPEKRAISPKTVIKPAADNEDILDGLDFDGDVFRSGKSSLHRNVKVKENRSTSPVRPKAAVSVTFTNKPVLSTPVSRLPRPLGSHERAQTQPSLEPVSESGGPILPRPPRRSQSRLGHSAQSSISSVHTPTTPSSAQPLQFSTPRRRELSQKASTGALRNEPTTTSAQLLRLKRSLPAMRHNPAPAKPAFSRFERPPSRTDSRTESSRPQSVLRPKTPVDRVRPSYEGSAQQARKNPFLPAGASQSQSQHVSARATPVARPFRRHDSDRGPELRPLSRAVSRTTARSPSPRRARNEKMTAEPIWQQINKPRRVRRFGDGHELDSFDDLPTSAQAESKYMKQPVGSGNRTNIRNKIYQNVLPDRNTPSPVSPYSPAKLDSLPHFARDTAASRIARETSLAQRTPTSGPLGPVANQRVAQLSSRGNFTPHHSSSRLKKSLKTPQLKPHLISNLNSAKETKVVNGMTYNPTTFRWEGNDNALNAFDVPSSSPTVASLPPHLTREREGSTSRPVLITNMTATKGVKRVGDMVFDPQNMCWLKADTTTPTTLSSDPMEGFNALDDDDPFKDIPDLDDKDKDSVSGGHGRGSDLRDDWLVGEEFDVGPEFVRRQHEEETRWRRKCGPWNTTGTRERADIRWALRNMILEQ